MPAPGNKNPAPLAGGTGQRNDEAWKIYRNRIASSIIALDRQRARSMHFDISSDRTIRTDCVTGWPNARRKKKHFLKVFVMETNSSFDKWQADYAAHGVATFPVDGNKRPMVSRYNQFGLVGSAEIASKFGHAPAIGFMCGKRN